MVEVRMRQQERVDRLRVIGEGHPVAAHLFGRALEHAAVDDDSALPGGDQELRAGDRADGPEELDLDGHAGRQYGRDRETMISRWLRRPPW